MRRKLVAILVSSLFAGGASAQDTTPLISNWIWKGSITGGGRYTDTDGDNRNGAFGTSSTTVQPFMGPPDPAKAQEYQDTQSGPIGVIDIMGANRGYYLRGYGENFGRDDQFINVLGGGWGSWRGQVYSDRIPHNLSFNALSPLQGSGTTLMTNPGTPPYPPAINPAFWNTFNYSLQRNTVGGNFEVSANSPFFVRADYNEVTMTGTRPGGGQLGTGSSNGIIELGIPTDFKTRNSTIEAGYVASTWNVKLAFLDSRFSNGQETAQWTNFYMRNALDTSILPPDNDLQKWSLNATWRGLPWNSQILVRATQSKLSNSFGIIAGGLKPTGNQSPPVGVGTLVTTPSSSTFDGNIETTTATVSWNATPFRGLDTRVYYEYYDKENSSTSVSYAAGGLGPAAGTCPASNDATRFCIDAFTPPANFEYTRNIYGVDATYRIDARQKLLAQYNYVNTDRELEQAMETRLQRFWIEYRNSKWANWSGRLRYQYLQQRSDLDPSINNNGTATPSSVAYYFTAYDVNNFDQNMVKLTVDWTPLPLLSVGFQGTWRGTDFKDNFYGRTEDRSQLYDLTVTYGTPDKFQITALANYGEIKFDQAYRTVSSGSSPLPDAPTNSTNFNWGTRNTQSWWLVALMAEWVPMDNLRLTSSLSYQDTGGGVDFTSDNTQGAGGFQGGPLVNYATDNTKLTRFQLKGDYIINKNWSVTAGYWYNKYEYNDGQMAGYQGYYPYFQNLGSTNNSWFTGAFANPGYTQNIVYLTATYRF